MCSGESIRETIADCPLPTPVPNPSTPTPCSDDSICYGGKQEMIYYQCGREVERVHVADCPLCVPTTTAGECSQPCGMGNVTYTTTYCGCKAPTYEVRQEDCGLTIDLPPTEWSDCNAVCGGGIRERMVNTVCAHTGKVLKYNVETAVCNNLPCSYWAGWTEFGLCSATCGQGVQQRFRQCVGGNPDPWGNTDNECQGSSVDTRACDMGDCCTFPWSAWSECCTEDNGVRNRLRWKGFNKDNLASCQNDEQFYEEQEICGHASFTYGSVSSMSLSLTCASLRITTGFIREHTLHLDLNWIHEDRVITTFGGEYTFIIENGRVYKKAMFGREGPLHFETYYTENEGYIYLIGNKWWSVNNGNLHQTVGPQATNIILGYAPSGDYFIGGNQYELFVDGNVARWTKYTEDGLGYNKVEIEYKNYGNEIYYNFDGKWYTYYSDTGFTPVMSEVLPWDNEVVTKVIHTETVYLDQTSQISYVSDSTRRSYY